MNLVPLRTILQYLNANINRDIIITNLLGNVVAFMPMGFLLPLVSKKYSGFFKTVLLSAGLSLMIEALQYVLAVGATDIDDLFLNTLGGMLGYLIFLVCRKVYLGHLQSSRTKTLI
jgi:glycopeptide antibiotics resistance protein